MTAGPNLDPDEVTCPRCAAAPGAVCRTPAGRRAATIHAARRRAADGTEPHRRSPSAKRGPAPNVANLTPEARAKGGRRTAQERRRRKAELAAATEARREAAEAEALDAEAARLADDAAKYARDRQLLRRKALDATVESVDAFRDALAARKRVEIDDDGKPRTIKVERRDAKGLPLFDQEGERVLDEVPDVLGYVTEANIERLAKVWATTLGALRLEEGKPTGITEQQSGGTSAALGEAGVEELVTWAQQNLSADGPQ